MPSLFTELRRRNVFKVGAAYAIVAWLLVQVVDVVLPALQMPEWTISFVTVLLIIGFPITLIMAWAFEMTPEGVKADADVQRDSITPATGQRLNYVILGLVVLAVGFLVTIAGCQQPPNEAAFRGTETSKDFGDYVVHFSALTTDQLTAEIAQRYGIVRSKNRAMLNVNILKKEEGTIGTPVAGEVSVFANNLTGQLKNITVREIREGEAIYYIGECSITNRETLIFTIDVTPINEASSFSVRYMKQFFED